MKRNALLLALLLLPACRGSDTDASSPRGGPSQWRRVCGSLPLGQELYCLDWLVTLAARNRRAADAAAACLSEASGQNALADLDVVVDCVPASVRNDVEMLIAEDRAAFDAPESGLAEAFRRL